MRNWWHWETDPQQGFPAAQTPHDTPRRRLLTTLRTTDPSHKTPPHTLSCTDDEVTANPSHSSPTVPTSRSRCRYAEGRPGGRPLGVSHQHSASSPSKLLKTSLVGITRARVARAAFPCDDTYCRRPTLRQRQGQLRKSWDFDPTDNWTQNECSPLTSIDQMAWCLGEKRPAPPEVIRGRGHTVSQRDQLRRRPESAKLYHFQPIQWPPVYIAPESVLR